MRNPFSYRSEDFQQILARYVGEDTLKHAESVVNMGCGNCKEANALDYYHGNNITHFDINAEQIEEARKSYPDFSYRFVTQDATNLDQFPTNSVDIAYLIHPVAADSTTKDLLKEANRMLKKKGLLFSCTYFRAESEILRRRIYKAGLTSIVHEENDLFEYPTYGLHMLDTGAYRFVSVSQKIPLSPISRLKRSIIPLYAPKLI